MDKEALLDIIKKALDRMTPEERVDFIYCVRTMYCQHCGYFTDGEWCQCENDE